MKNRTNKITITFLFVASLITILPSCTNGPKEITGRYINETDPEKYIEFLEDEKWIAQGARGFQQTGTYTYAKESETIIFELMGSAVTTSFNNDTIIVPRQSSWVVPSGTFTKQ